MAFPWLIFVPLVDRMAYSIQPKIELSMWKDLFVPILLVLQLIFGWNHESSIWMVALSLAAYYFTEIGLLVRGSSLASSGYTGSVILHHLITVLIIVWALLIWNESIAWATQWVLLSEVSTIFLNMRPILKILKAGDYWIDMNRNVFLYSFIVFRIFVSPFIYAYVSNFYAKLLYTGLVALNIYWLRLYYVRRSVC